VALHPLNTNWNSEVLIFVEGGKTGEHVERERTNKQLYSYVAKFGDGAWETSLGHSGERRTLFRYFK
jgi:hypothetical protein